MPFAKFFKAQSQRQRRAIARIESVLADWKTCTPPHPVLKADIRALALVLELAKGGRK